MLILRVLSACNVEQNDAGASTTKHRHHQLPGGRDLSLTHHRERLTQEVRVTLVHLRLEFWGTGLPRGKPCEFERVCTRVAVTLHGDDIGQGDRVLARIVPALSPAWESTHPR